eukprot:Nk52_evm1s288 gene=Nk52_evmTU1s288
MVNNFAAIAGKYPEFTTPDVEKIYKQFQAFDHDDNGSIDCSELFKVLKELGEKPTLEYVRKQINAVDKDNSGTIEFNEFLDVVSAVRKAESKGVEPVNSPFTSRKLSKVVTLTGSSDNIAHSFSEDEKESFVKYMNDELKGDEHLANLLPIDADDLSVFEKVKSGLLLCKLINVAVPDTIDERVLNVKAKLNQFEMTENQNVCINSCKAIGCSVVNIGAQDLIEGRVHLVLGLIWQIIKIGLLSKVTLQNHPELYRLLYDGETLEDFLKLPPDQILLRWVNFHLKNAGHAKKMTNFSSDIKDGEIYTVLLNQLDAEHCSLNPLKQPDLLQRAQLVLDNADSMDPPCAKFVTPKSITQGNAKLNLAFLANLFNEHPGLEPLSEEEAAAIDDFLFNSKGDREARAFALWINSLGIEPFVHNLYEDLKDGVVLLRTFDVIEPGVVVWKKVNQTPKMVFKKLENTNYCVVLGKSLKFSLVAIGGSDITEGNKSLTLALVWQMMRHHVIGTLKSISKDGTEVTDSDMIAWANGVVAKAGKTSSFESFKDPSLANGRFFLDLMGGLKKGIVNYDLVTDGENEEDAKSNAKYAISIARKLGACIFLLPEDIVEVKPKMILTFIGALMAMDHQ